MKNNEKPLVSIITPTFMCDKFIEKTILSVLNQTYDNYEMIIVDDNSEDNTQEIVSKYTNNNKKIKYYKLDKTSGAAYARNYALKKAKGRFIAFLDADDLWDIDKLEKQVAFMLENKYAFTCTGYEKITEDGESLKKIIMMPKKITYNFFLRNTIIQIVGVMIDKDIVGEKLIKMPAMVRRQDAATWANILKNGYNCYGVPYKLAYYRVVHNSLSSNKILAARTNWRWYRDIEKLSLFKTIICFTGYAFNAVKKRLYIKKWLHLK